ncbi:beta-mannanase [Rathayibacter sp. ZW T2_19]|uniref:Beta-mannanase n=1 Tax=Rathayibacter rubneri TaxID=2950106 RepID=A0A9X2DXH4_9MICO|nr:glycosyl hydrolase [Rathayibacter rubneri]MCM6762021.1 beta-mannanase [Rathayibacter rubneri]
MPIRQHPRSRLLAAVLALGVAAAALVAAPTAAAAAAPASIVLSPASGPVGTNVVVTGAAFPKRSAGSLSVLGRSAAFTTNGSGAFTASITIPAAPAGPATVSARAGSATATAVFTVTAPPAAPVISGARLRFGVTTPGGASANAELDAVAALAGESPSIIVSYQDFGQPAPLADLRSVAARGATSLITWEPWRWGGGVDQPAYSSARIIAGDHDAYLTSWARDLAAWGSPVLLRYAHEMNGDWYPWSDGVNGNAPGSYAAAWNHVHAIFQAQGATNVQWVWSPNVPYDGSVPLDTLFPGSASVDVLALDGYNWGTATTWSSWTSAGALFAAGLDQVRSLAPGTPIIIGETASAEAGGSKAAWISDLVGYLNVQQDVVGLVWFHHDKEVDWRIDSSPSSAAAFAGALAARRA